MKNSHGTLLVGRMMLAVGLVLIMSNPGRAQIWSQIMAEKGLTAQEVASEKVPEHGTFWSFQRTNFPPLPFNQFPDLPVYYLGYGNAFLVDDSLVDFVALAEAREADKALRKLELQYGLREADELDALEEAEGGGMMLMAYEYPTNNALWLEITSVTNGLANLVVHGTVPDETYEILSKETLTNTIWASEGTIIGAAEQDWTLTMVPVGQRTNSLFLWARSWVDSDGDGLPDWYELEVTGTDPNNPDTGNTGVSDGYKDSDNDGSNNLQEYQNGTNPNSFTTPPPPIPFNAFVNPGGSNVTLTWSQSSGPVLQYLVERADVDPNVGLGAFQTIAQPSPGTLSITDSGSFGDFDPDYGLYSPDWSLPHNSVYRIRAIYAGGQSQTVEAVLNGGDPALAVDVQLVRNASGRWQLLCPAIPPQVTKLRLNWFAWDYFWDFGYFLSAADLSVTNLATGVYVIPDAEITQHLAVVDPQFPQDGPVPAEGQVLWVQGVNAAGKRGRAVKAGTILQDAPCFTDGRAHLKQNLMFQLRAATVNTACSVSDIAWWNPFYVPVEVVGDTNYVESSFLHRTTQFKGVNTDHFDFIQLNDLWPFTLNYQLHNRLYDPTNTVPTSFEWQTNLVTTPAPAVLGVGAPYWIAQDLNNLPEVAAGIAGSSLFLQSGAHNLFGLAFTTALVNYSGYILDPVTGLPVPVPMITLAPGGSVASNLANVFFSQTLTPALQSVGYYFAPVFTPGTQIQWGYPTIADQPHPLPVNLGFAASNQTPLIIASANKPIVIGGWAKLAITNGYNTKFAYLGQYFDKAFKTTNGVVTTNATGILSPYGEFFPTEPGPTALVTMPDLDTNQRGTATVHVVKLQLDVNHDSIMDLSFTGPDNTSPNRPFRFWVNNDYDVSSGTADLGGHEGNPQHRINSSDPGITCQRDLEDFARLWICGMPALTNGYQVTLSMNSLSGNPAINLVNAVETNGGTLYLSSSNTAYAQVYDPYGQGPGQKRPTISATNALTLSANLFTNSGDKYFLFEGRGIGQGELVLTITQNLTNIIAQTSTWLDMRDVKDLYERVVVTNTTTGGITNWSSAIQTIEYPKVSMDDDTNIIVFVHGINNTVPDWLTSSDTIFKRLYWTGYRGKFASLRWPCKYLPWNTFHPFDFNLSEFYGYKSGAALRDYLNQLRQLRFPNYQLHIYAHSQGGAVASDAISRYGAPFDTLVLSQAAMPASGYDIQAPTVPDLLTNELFEPTPQWQPMGYRGIYTNITGRVVNFFNTNDYALGIWVVDQKLSKPDGLLGARNYTSDGTNGYAIIDIGLYRLVTDSQECRGMVARSRTPAIGAQGPVSGQTTQGVVDEAIDLKTQFGFFDTRPEHSAQITRPIQTVRPYYQQLLRSCQLQPAP